MPYILVLPVVFGIIVTPFLLKRRQKPPCRYVRHFQTESIMTRELTHNPPQPISMPGMALPPLWEQQFNEITFPYWEEQRKEHLN